MARPAKYATPELREAARRESKRAYYARNAPREREAARKRWQSALHAKQEKRRKEAKSARPLRATEKVLGAALLPDCKTNWLALEKALRIDLASWRGVRSPTDHKEYDTLTHELISCSDQAERTRQRLLARISRKQELLTAIQAVARAADGALMDANPGRYSAHFLQLSRDALIVDSVLDDLMLRYRESAEYLRDAYARGTLYWQTL